MKPKTTYYHIERGHLPGWWKIVSKATGANVAEVRGYPEALAEYRRLNKAKAGELATAVGAGKGRAA
jgi:hypothetical protein